MLAVPIHRPASIGKYRVIELLGQGTFGAVYRCEDPTLGREVCIKVPHRGGQATAEDVERFQREARTAARLSHPHIVPVFDAGFDDGRLFLVMELIEGQTLDQLIGTSRLTTETTLRVIFHLAQALQAAHDQGVIHRDVKPANVLIDHAGRPKLTDFGLARLNDNSPALSRTGDLIGTPRYMSPEQALLPSNQIDHRTDLYSLGAVMYEMLGGVPVADGPTAMAVLKKVTDEPVPPLPTDTPADVASICLKLLAKNRDERFGSAAEVARAIQDVMVQKLFGTPEVEMLAGLPARKFSSPRWPWFVGGAVVAGALAMLLIVLFRPNVEPVVQPVAVLDPAQVVQNAEAERLRLGTIQDERTYRTALAELLDELNAAVKQHPTNSELRAVRGQVLRRAGEPLAAVADLEMSTEPALVLERTLARYQWEVVMLHGINDHSLRPTPSNTLVNDLKALPQPMGALGLAVVQRDEKALNQALAALVPNNTSPDLAMMEADAWARLASEQHQESESADAMKKIELRKLRDEYDTRSAQAIRRGLAVDPHHLGLLFLKAAAWHRRIPWEASDGDDRDQLERRHRPAFETAYQRYRVGCLRWSVESATGRAILLASAGRNDQALDILNEAVGRGPLPPTVAALRAWLQLAAPPDWDLTPTHAALVLNQLAPVLEQHPDEHLLWMVKSVATMATGRWEEARRDLLECKKVYRGPGWPIPGSIWNSTRDVVKTPTHYLDSALDHITNFPINHETKLKLGDEFMKRLNGNDVLLRQGFGVEELKEYTAWGHFRQAKFHAEKDNRAAVLHHVRAALAVQWKDVTIEKIRTDGNLKAWNDDQEFQKMYAGFVKK
jgi:predicted Ser/Thr protein kinase/tetratricopeptide (TPR) repeat protein